MSAHFAAPPSRCQDCNEPIRPGQPVRVEDGQPLCVACDEIRDLAWRGLEARSGPAHSTRRGPRHHLPHDVSAETTVRWSGGGLVERLEPIREVSPRGFRVEAHRPLAEGQRLSCEASLPGMPVRAPLPLDVEVRWCQPGDGGRFRVGVEVVDADLGRYGEWYRALVSGLGPSA